ASLVRINAYDQPGVEAGKKAATEILALQRRVRKQLPAPPGQTAEELATALQADAEEVYHVLRHLVANDSELGCSRGDAPAEDKFFRM
nr:glucose-6-phosphate isomerase [Chthoniobacterales bacterium]